MDAAEIEDLIKLELVLPKLNRDSDSKLPQSEIFLAKR